ncbi:MAG: SPOR domain-containing protein [Magnetococcales bacterium]|nr:SPOR domain-containing protein [Magnetococcales bacterium]
MAIRLPAVFGIVPLLLVVILATLNVAVLINGLSSKDVDGLWEGPLMPKKYFPLPDISMAKIIDATGIRIRPKEASLPAKLEMAKKIPTSDPVTPPSAIDRSKYIVQLGEFDNQAGVDVLVAAMKARGYDPKVNRIQKPGHMNEVQAGPFINLEQARRAEVLLRASGMDVWVDRTEQGHVISLTKSENLFSAMAVMERVKALEISPLKLIKVASDAGTFQVFMGPYNSKEKADEVFERMESISLTEAKIEKWKPAP